MTEFSVVVPTYQRTDELVRALDSIKSQTYRDFELLVIDDNPEKEYREKVREIVEEFREQASFSVKLLINSDKQGVSSARNLGIENSEGEYIAFLDDDDWWKPEKLERELDAFENNEYDAVYSAIEMYRDGEVKDIVRKRGEIGLEDILEKDMIGSPSKVTVTKKYLERIDGFDEDIPSGEDWDLWIRLIKEGCTFGYIDEPLVRYQQENNSKSSQMDIATEGREKITEKYSELLDQAGSKVKAQHHLNRAKKQYTLGDNEGVRRHLSKTLKNNLLEPEAYALMTLYTVRRTTGLDMMQLAVKAKDVLK
ncbi:glycosyltransferase family 2 protein [Candidatus Nanohalovita haloferacivicina]|uniref:glycosyltransferase family 2 protein n=1 Tax=Candidatus Nanohalovita haloferacivicina TaxID=2978046 RepID=UPI00325FAA19|nr:Glycosyl transferase family 2 [Candidatus Nanohalobia archaeon BNXNv]